VPEGFYDNTPEKIKDIFKKDQHYLIEVGGIKDGEGLIAEYVFIF